MLTLTLLLASLTSPASLADAPVSLFQGQLQNGESCELLVEKQGEELVTLRAKVAGKTLTFYNELLDESGGLPTEAESYFDKDLNPIIGAPILWAGRLNKGNMRIQSEDGQVTGFKVVLRGTIGFGKIPVGTQSFDCR